MPEIHERRACLNSTMAHKKDKGLKGKRSRKIHDEDQAIDNNNITESIHNGQEDDKNEGMHKNPETHQEKLERPIQEEENMAAYVEMKKRKKKALLEFGCRVEDAILGNYLLEKPNKNLSPKENAKAIQQLKEITIWGVPLLPSKGHEGTNIVLMKFLIVNDFKVHSAFKMLRKTLRWRRDYKADGILDERLDPDLAKIMRLSGTGRKGHPLCYNVYGALKDKELYNKIFEREEGLEKFVRLKVHCIEKGIQQLDFEEGEANSIIQITDLKNSPGAGMNELRSASKKNLTLLQDHYPEIIHKKIIINAPFWYYASHMLSSRLLQRTKSKFVFARPSNVTATLLKYIKPENIPVEYGGLKRENDDEFFPEDEAIELTVRGNSADCIEIPVTEPGVTMVWDLTVVGWDVSYQAEFIPDDEGLYTVLIQKEKEKKVGESVRNSFYINEPGKIVITINNTTMKKKSVYYRYKAKATFPIYIFFKK